MSEDLSKLEKKHTAVRSMLMISKIAGTINDVNEPVDQFKAFLEQLNGKEKLWNLTTLKRDGGFDIGALLRFLNLEIRSRELSFQINNRKPCRHFPAPQERAKNKNSFFPGHGKKLPLSRTQNNSLPPRRGEQRPEAENIYTVTKSHER
ncbi:hypothetical protein TNCT_613481 [Trichonephila clavata]|uniref:Uncharacterized protein n=1 Tax=Trichonephila clavata TaxID=2740835 RepID=A0A8X6FR61_TRICU|nr:hypothetical protein TNCT_613481 [Trichonephila clavata]